MKITIENTDQLVTTREGAKARVWIGVTDGGVQCYLHVAKIAVPAAADNAAFEKELHEVTPRRLPDSFDLRLIL